MKVAKSLAIAFLLAVFFACSGSFDVPESKQRASRSKSDELSVEDRVDYQMAAEDAVKQYLKYPLDAEFNPGLLSVADVTRAGTDVHVTGTVVAKNALGGELTHQYRVVFSEDGDVSLVQLGDEVVYVSQKLIDAVEESVEEATKATSAATAAAEEDNKYRTWTDNTGQHQVEAKFLEFKAGKVSLERRDGKIIEMSPNRLSDDDVNWYREELKRRQESE